METIGYFILVMSCISVLFSGCTSDKYTYTPEDESIYIATERINDDMYRIYLSKNLVSTDSCSDYIDLRYRPYDIAPDVWICPQNGVPDIYVYDRDGGIIDFKESKFNIKIVGWVSPATSNRSSSQFDSNAYYKERKYPDESFWMDSTGLINSSFQLILNPYMRGLTLIDSASNVSDAKVICKTHSTGWERPSKGTSKPNYFSFGKDRLCIQASEKDGDITLRLGVDSVFQNDMIDIPFLSRYDIELYYFPPDTIYISHTNKPTAIKFNKDKLHLINLDFWPYEFMPEESEEIHRMYRKYRQYIDSVILKDRYYFKIRDFRNKNGMSVRQFYGGNAILDIK